MFRRFLAVKVSIPLAGALALGLLVTTQITLADYTPGTYLDTQTFMIGWHLQRVSAGVIACQGSCRSAQAAGANPQRCTLIEANQATAAACLTQLAADCTPQNVVNCASGQQ